MRAFRIVLVPLLFAAALPLALVGAEPLGGASPAKNKLEAGAERVDPRRFGLNLEPGERIEGGDRRVLTADAAGAEVVGRIHVEIGPQRVVLLPDGRLVVRSREASPLTDRPFEALSKEALAERLTSGRLAGFKTGSTNRYLYVFNTSETYARGTSRILETMFLGVVRYAQAQRIEVHRPEVPLVVIMFATEEEFQQYRPMPPGVMAYYDPVSNHVVLYENSRRRIRADLAIQQAISTIAHEGAHQILHNIGVQQRLSRWPTWISEGLAEFFAPTTMDEQMKWKGAGQVNDMRMFELEQYVQSRAAEEPRGDLVHDTVLADRLTSTGYASAWALTHFLADKYRANFHAYVRDLSRLGPLQGAPSAQPGGIIPDNLKLFRKHFAEDGAKLEKRLVLHLKSLDYRDPFADLPHFVGLAVFQAGGRTQHAARMFHTAKLARQWQEQIQAKLPAEQRGQLKSEIREFPNRAVAERFTQQWLRGR